MKEVQALQMYKQRPYLQHLITDCHSERGEVGIEINPSRCCQSTFLCPPLRVLIIPWISRNSAVASLPNDKLAISTLQFLGTLFQHRNSIIGSAMRFLAYFHHFKTQNKAYDIALLSVST
jgi:hypothetical protein